MWGVFIDGILAYTYNTYDEAEKRWEIIIEQDPFTDAQVRWCRKNLDC